jgi:DNA-binding response OmpR family regulator
MMNQKRQSQRLFAARSETISVLVVEDSPALGDLVCRALESAGCEAWLAVSGEAALELLPENDWDVLVADLDLPGISGLDLLRLRDPTLPAILMSAQELDGIEFELAFLDAVWLRKPFSPAKLIELVLTRHGQTGLAV